MRLSKSQWAGQGIDEIPNIILTYEGGDCNGDLEIFFGRPTAAGGRIGGKR
jgi:hypothetical protein